MSENNQKSHWVGTKIELKDASKLIFYSNFNQNIILDEIREITHLELKSILSEESRIISWMK